MHQSCADLLENLTRESGEYSQYDIFEYQSQVEEVAFENEEEQQFYTMPPPSADMGHDRSPEELGDFLKRPTIIETIYWDPAGVSDADIDPWTDFLKRDEIKAKLDNFAFFRADMHIKVVVNASPFYYGAMLINYTPLPSHVHPCDDIDATALLPQSQKPHLWIDLRENKGGEMVLHLSIQQITLISLIIVI